MATKDKILQMFFEKERWTYAIEKGVGKDINRAHLYQLTKPEVRARMYQAILSGTYEIVPPHTAQIPKENGDMRTVYVNEPIDRIFLSITNDLLIELMPEMTSPACKSYQKGLGGCSKIVQDVSRKLCRVKGKTIGFKSDLSKYFDSVPLPFIDQAFDMVEAKHGHSAVIDVLRKYYHDNRYFDIDGVTLRESYQSLKQGCAVASWLSNVMLRDIDEKLAKMGHIYVRYSDDMLYIGSNYEKAMELLTDSLARMDMKLNPKKVEYISSKRRFKFLGFAIKGREISLAGSRIKLFQKEIEKRTIRHKGVTLNEAVNDVNSYLYRGNGQFSWSTAVLGVCNVKQDIDKLNAFVVDCLRAVQTRRRKVGSLGYEPMKKVGCITRGRGKNVKGNMRKTAKDIPGYLTLGCMQNALTTRRAVYNTLVANL